MEEVSKLSKEFGCSTDVLIHGRESDQTELIIKINELEISYNHLIELVELWGK